MAEIPPVLVRIQADVDQLKAGLREAEASLKNFDGDVKRTGSTVGGFGDTVKKLGATLGATFAIGGLVSFFRSSVQGAMEAESALSRLRQLLITTGGATEAQIAILEAQADALSKVGSASKENILVTQSQLATFDLQGKTIETLTPAILDYVAAEKGASATTMDYKSMTNGLAQALNGNFQSLTRVGFVLDAQTKKQIKSGTESERAAAIVQVLNSTYEGFNKTLSETPAGRMAKLKKEFDDLKQTIGQALLPVIQTVVGFLSDSLIPMFKKAADFVKNLSQNLVGGGSLGEAFNTVKTQVTNFLKPIVDLMKKLSGPDSLSERIKDIVKSLKDFFVPVLGAVKTAITKVRDTIVANGDKIKELLDKYKEIWAWINQYIVPLFKTVLVSAIKGAGTVISTFINLIVPTLSGVLDGVKLLINGIIFVVNKLITAYNTIGARFGKAPLDYIEKIGEQAKTTTTALDQLEKSGARAVKTVSTPVDLFDRQGGGGDPWKGSKDPAAALTKEEIARMKKIDALKKKVKDTVDNMNEAIKDAQDRAADALTRRKERLADAEERYYETVGDANKRYNEAIASAEERAAESRADAQARHEKTQLEARARNAKQLIDITKDYNKKVADLEQTLQDRQADIREAGEKKRQEITATAAERQAGIVRQAIDRLRSAFASKTGIDIAQAFKLEENTTEMRRTEGGLIQFVRKVTAIKGDVGNLLVDLKTKLTTAKELQANAAALAGMGYSQLFIEEIVKAGPEAGNKMAAALRSASPETSKEIQALYAELESLTNTGLDDLAKKMNSGGKLATSELTAAYNEVAVDLQRSLAIAQQEVNKSLVEAQSSFDKAMEQAKIDRNERQLEALDQLQEALKDSKAALDEALADAEKTLAKSREGAQKNLSESLAEAQKTLQKALIDAQKDYEKSIDDINKSTEKKLADLRKNIAEIALSMKELGAAKEATAAIATGSAVGGGLVKKSTAPTIIVNQIAPDGTSGGQINVAVTGVNMTSPQATAAATTSAIKYGQAVLVGGTTIRAPQSMLEGLGKPIK